MGSRIKHNKFLNERSSNFNHELFFQSSENAKCEKSAVLISLVYPCSRKEIRLIGQDLPFYKSLLATSPDLFGALCYKSFLKRGAAYAPAHSHRSEWVSASPRKHLSLAPFARAKADACSEPLWTLTWREDGYISEQKVIPEDTNTGWILGYPHWDT